MAITGTKVKTNTSNKNWFINHCRIVEAEQIDSQYNDCSIRMKYEDVDSGYNYTAFINQNFEKDNNGIVTGLKYPDDVNTLYLAANADLNVSDIGQVNVEKLIGKEVAVLNYKSTGKYKNATWGVVSSLDKTDELGKRFMDQVAKGYPKNYLKPTPEVLEARSGDTLDNGMKVDDLPF